MYANYCLTKGLVQEQHEESNSLMNETLIRTRKMRDWMDSTGFVQEFNPSQIQSSRSGWPLVEVKFDHPIQSPVDIITSKAETLDLPTLNIVDPPQPNIMAKFYNSGHTAYVHIEEDPTVRPYLKGGPLRQKFIFEQVHFHWGTEDVWGTEHFIDGESYSIEVHAVHFNSKYPSLEVAATKPDGLAVLTIFAEANNDDNELIEPLHKLLPQITQPNDFVYLESIKAMQWPVSSLFLNNEYYTYPGSLTTHPYTENVTWILLPKAITLSYNQLRAFRELHSEHNEDILENKRNVQPLHNRPIVRSTNLM